ncbi:c-type cytochrome [Urechidicola vernalis]|uniref:Cytochrome c n=1 Tax=Urechidicola vernalis TaxID=3075600 RepID=A0ABU2Y909_9FLAO|nr:cytochrome c [Urechidicola sp. P050]MDT0554237.1 cytochrome c [Urechidicola sp. P050]
MKIKLAIVAILALVVTSCGGDKKKVEYPVKSKTKTEAAAPAKKVDPMTDKGIGPVTSITLGELDQAMVTEGEQIFKAKCSACHKISKRFIGPGMKGVTERRTPEWIMNMILNPEEMVQKNQIAMDLLKEYNAPMANQSLTEDEARKILEYFRTKN